MDLKQIVILALQVSILATGFGFGLKTRPDDLMYLFHRPGLLIRSVFSVLVVMPILAIAITRTFSAPATTEIALMALAISPVPPLLPRREAKAGGQESYGLALLFVLSVLALVAIPAWIGILQLMADRRLGAAPGAVARIVLIMAVVPLLLGVAVRKLLPAVADRIDNPIALLARILLPIAAVILLIGAWRGMWNATGSGTVLEMVMFIAAGLLVGHPLGGPDLEHSTVLALSTACRHPAIALTIASANFPEQRFGATILLYLIVNALVGVPYVAWQKRQQQRTLPV